MVSEWSSFCCHVRYRYQQPINVGFSSVPTQTNPYGAVGGCADVLVEERSAVKPGTNGDMEVAVQDCPGILGRNISNIEA